MPFPSAKIYQGQLQTRQSVSVLRDRSKNDPIAWVRVPVSVPDTVIWKG